jgi:hypothetical protein
MPPVLAYAAPAPEVDLLAAYDEHCDRLGLISVNLRSAARTFLRRWPDSQAWDPMTGRARKFEMPFGLIGPAFAILSALRRVRGTQLDILGKTKHRREERQRIEDYKRQILGLLGQLSAYNYDAAVRIASIPQMIRGYDSVKDESAQRAAQLQQAYVREFAEASKP